MWYHVFGRLIRADPDFASIAGSLVQTAASDAGVDVTTRNSALIFAAVGASDTGDWATKSRLLSQVSCIQPRLYRIPMHAARIALLWGELPSHFPSAPVPLLGQVIRPGIANSLHDSHMYAVYFATRLMTDWMRGDFDQGVAVSQEFHTWATNGGVRTDFYVLWALGHRALFAVLRGDVAAARELMPHLDAFFKIHTGERGMAGTEMTLEVRGGRVAIGDHG